jgi:cob(I)alamin adenosyltransferase
MRPYGRQLLICEHGDCVPPEAAQRLAERFRALARVHGLTMLRKPQRVKCTLSGCLGVCAGGPILVIYPDGTWYHHVDDALLEWIVTEHLLAARPVDTHIFHRLGADGVVLSVADATVYAPDYSGDADDTAQASAGTQLGSTPEAIARRQAARTARTQKGLLIVYTGQGKRYPRPACAGAHPVTGASCQHPCCWPWGPAGDGLPGWTGLHRLAAAAPGRTCGRSRLLRTTDPGATAPEDEEG